MNPTTKAGMNLWEWSESDALPINEFGFASVQEAIVAIERQAQSIGDWYTIARYLGLPFGWRLWIRRGRGDWRLTAAGADPMPCGHRSMQVTATHPLLAVARMSHRAAFHRSGG